MSLLFIASSLSMCINIKHWHQHHKWGIGSNVLHLNNVINWVTRMPFGTQPRYGRENVIQPTSGCYVSVNSFDFGCYTWTILHWKVYFCGIQSKIWHQTWITHDVGTVRIAFIHFTNGSSPNSSRFIVFIYIKNYLNGQLYSTLYVQQVSSESTIYRFQTT